MSRHRIAARIPPAEIRWYPRGEPVDPSRARPGAWMLVDHGTFVDGTVGVAQHVAATVGDRTLLPFIWARHAALIVPGALVHEMGAHGLEERPLEHYAARTVALVDHHFGTTALAGVLENDAALAHVGYGWTSYLGVAADEVTRGHISGTGSGVICSAHVALSLMGSGLFFPDRPAGVVAPMHLARYVNAVPPPR